MGNYEALHGGYMWSAFDMLVANPHRSYWTEIFTNDELWEAIYRGDQEGAMMTVGSYA